MDKSAFTPFEVLTSDRFTCWLGLNMRYLNRLVSSYDGGFGQTTLRHLVLVADGRSGSLESNYS